jgi:hypothetical protein
MALPSSECTGTLVESLVDTVRTTEKQQQPKSGKLTTLKPAERDFIRLVVIGEGTTMPCSNVDCPHEALMLIESRDQDVLAFCKDCGWVEFAHWQAGV